jgi:hypothetical protein
MKAVSRKEKDKKKRRIIPKANFVPVTIVDDRIIKTTVNTFLNLVRP